MFSTQIDAIVPMLCVTLAALASMGAEAFRARDERMPIGILGIVGLVSAAISAALLWNRNAAGFGVIAADNFGLFVTIVLAIVGVLTIMFSSQVLERDGLPSGEYYALVLFAIVGMIMMATATDLLVIFIALEVLSLSVYVLTAIRRDHLPGTEAAFKYFLLGAFSSAFFLYGIAFTYGVTGSTRLAAVGSFLSAQSMTSNPMVLLALGLLLVGFAFKISAVPFHMWTPDAYEGAPAIVTGFMSTGVKAAAFAAFARVFLSAFEPFKAEWAPVVAVIAIATMVLGTVVGVAQSNLKRMLAYSTISQMGFMLLGLVAGSDQQGTYNAQFAYSASMFYIVTYVLTTLASFGIILLLAREGFESEEITDLAGLNQRSPLYAGVMAIAMFSLAGLPPLVGFYAKLAVLQALIASGQAIYIGLAVFAVMMSLIGAFYYLRVVKVMYFDAPVTATTVSAPRDVRTVLTINGALILILGIVPGGLMTLCYDAIVATLAH
jgi:NADH-quinone oxidoreductase subunit N